MAVQWIDRELHSGPWVGLCLSDKDFSAAMRKMGQTEVPAWIKTEHAGATAHSFENNEGQLCVIVCLRVRPGRTLIEVHGLLVHEAVHVFQDWCDRIGERHPSSEFEAYAIQRIAQRLMEAYEKEVNRGRTTPPTTPDAAGSEVPGEEPVQRRVGRARRSAVAPAETGNP